MTESQANEIDQYDYDLPPELIAQSPMSNRADARLMLVDRSTGSIDHYHIRDLPELLSAGDTLVMNNSRVIPARLVGYRSETGGRWQGLFLRSDDETGLWEILTKTRGKLQAGETITVRDRDARDGMLLTVVTRTDDGKLLVKPSTPEDMEETFASPADWLHRFGRVPIPPYIRDGQMVDADVVDYQTVYAKSDGSVAAPTAGLHFTKSLLEKVRAAGVGTAEVTLHVGIGTFRPIATERLDEHQMHSEWGQIDEPTVQEITTRRTRGRTIAVGTTSVRVLESAAAAGGGVLKPWTGETNLFIQPGFKFNAIDGLLTNFHLPKSSLLVLISALAGRELALKAYRVAIENEYRFYSYGDAMLIV
ncbi:S-adenosylmethionine:tRNA ribosyltransferase-isomerase [Rubripirellula obstinata]|uniref:S-adenosylmethionine:tRNA ribosyltransferase-isomerase n=1 Tax=Rubripirellula obstinata TaxID=406547 RepID=A0A5B1CC82_9BACT|nr:tRNA preQ1(34) S-adenosylmethionine ribosyltransferase-isomerase QueA [Rubripirellula obstinata]KAA1258788.1 S-adenosylmethionine:tRNA ribosyltransferase-isomerase [Rubripirellula obstinata]